MDQKEYYAVICCGMIACFTMLAKVCLTFYFSPTKMSCKVFEKRRKCFESYMPLIVCVYMYTLSALVF